MKSQFRARRSAFTLIELLTVIAIIAVLAAIIFPVFAAVRENARRADCMTNMKSISTALKQYELDNRKYPDFLFAPAIASGPDINGDGVPDCKTFNDDPKGKLVIATGNDPACTQEQASATGKLGGDFVYDDGVTVGGRVAGSGGLYPEYVKSLSTYSCKNNTWFYPTNDPAYSEAPGTRDYPVTTPKAFFVPSLDKNNIGTFADKYGDVDAPPALRFYKFDSYDTSPRILKDGSGTALAKIDSSQWIVRYQRQWMGVVNNPNDRTVIASDKARQLYQDQLIWRNPGDDAAVTMCSHHVEKGKVIVLYLSGTAKVVDIAALKTKEQLAYDAGVPYTTSDFDTFKMTP
ncbi:MAG: DUF1559 domain-containing protein [Akkermansiaceae bacterium]|nr:DUF1559 domain-containing protein [Armatimonadota bacterium]